MIEFRCGGQGLREGDIHMLVSGMETILPLIIADPLQDMDMKEVAAELLHPLAEVPS